MQLRARRPKSLRTIQERIESARKKRYEPPKNNQKVSPGVSKKLSRELVC